MIRFIRSLLTLGILLTFFLGCSSVSTVETNKRFLAEENIEAQKGIESYFSNRDKFIKLFAEERQKEYSVISDNLMKFFLYSLGKPEAERDQILQKAAFYFQMEVSKINFNMFWEDEGKTPADHQFYTFEHPPIWTLKDEVEYLFDQAEKYDANVRMIKVKDIKKVIFKGLKKGINSKNLKIRDFTMLIMLDYLTGKKKRKESKEMLYSKFDEFYENEKEKALAQLNSFLQENKIELKEAKVGQLIEEFMTFYFKNMDEEDFKTIISEMINVGAESSDEGMMDIVLRNTGPGLGKLLQQLGEESGVSDSLKPILKKLESNGKVVPIHLVRRLIEEDGGFNVTSLSDEPLGTGTMAQVHEAVIKLKNDDDVKVALRFLKPDIERRVTNDINMIIGFVQYVKESNTELSSDFGEYEKPIRSVEDFLRLELDIKFTIDQQEKAVDFYERSIVTSVDGKDVTVDFKVPRVFRPENGDSNLHVQEFVNFGVKFSDMDNLTQQKAVSRGIFRLWFEEALFRSGFIHADLHQGNFTVIAVEDSDQIIVYIFDYGMTKDLDENVRRGFMLIALGDKLMSQSIIAEGILAINGDKLKVSQKEMESIVAQAFEREEIDGAAEWVSWMLKNNYLLDDSIGPLARGGMLIKKLPEIVGDKEVIMKEQLRMGLREYWRAMANRSVQFPLTFKNQLDLGSRYIRNSCDALIEYIFKVPKKLLQNNQ